ncbi:MAG: hypothetical protein EAZ19_00470 [Oscillatoriales cyanobacterium]|nr:MAG: hypothetical protein EAZ19_00470 [Oscillatoriales cyanobacterium]
MNGVCLRAGILTIKSGTIAGNSPNLQLIHASGLPIEIENPRTISPTIHKKKFAQQRVSLGCFVNRRQLLLVPVN